MDTAEFTKNVKEEITLASPLGYPMEDKIVLVSKLNKLLANFSVHYQKLRNYHWNVTGSDFFDLHEKFEVQYNAARKYIDEIAERIRVFGMTPYSTMKDYLEQSIIPETEEVLSSQVMVENILADYKILIECLIEVIEEATEKADFGTEEMAKGYVKALEKNHWMMSAFLEK